MQKQFSRLFFLGLENSLNSRIFKKKPPPDANKMEKQVQSSDDADRG
jgi:hypothetical protein